MKYTKQMHKDKAINFPTVNDEIAVGIFIQKEDFNIIEFRGIYELYSSKNVYICDVTLNIDYIETRNKS